MAATRDIRTIAMSTRPDEDDRTVINVGPQAGKSRLGTVQPAGVGAGADPDAPVDTHGLRIGMRLGEFELTRRIGEGGFSIVYLAWDHSLDRNVALKEYMPTSIATRLGATQVGPRSERHRDTFEAGLKSFINEAKLLARFDHPALVKVYRFWEAHGTAYMVMPLYEGLTVKDTVRALPQPPDEAWLLGLLAPLTEALGVIHAEHCYHRDIAPDNVILLAGSGKPLLLDFGAARRVIGDMTQALTVILKPGYAPVEQYAEVPGMRQGPWTDVYALAAVVHWAITGKTPPPAVGRMMKDTHVPLAQVADGRYSPSFLRAIDRALAVLPEQRTQSVDALRQDLGLTAPGAESAALPSERDDPEATVVRSPGPVSGEPAGGARKPVIATQGTEAPPVRDHSSEAPGRGVGWNGRRLGAILGVTGVGAAVLAAGFWWALPKTPVELPPSASAPTASSAALPIPPKPAGSEPTPAQVPTGPRSPSEAIALAKAGSVTAINVVVRSNAPTLVTGRDTLRLSVTTSASGYLYVFAYREGSTELEILHGEDLGQRRPIDAGRAVELTMTAWDSAPPLPGDWRLLVLVSRQPRDLGAAGWRRQGELSVRTFGPGDASTPPAWGSPVCAPGTAPCDNAYGVDELAVTVMPDNRPTPVAEGVASAPLVTQSERKSARTPPRVEAVKTERRAEAPGNSTECARTFQRLSLGESSPELLDRVKTLNCR